MHNNCIFFRNKKIILKIFLLVHKINCAIFKANESEQIILSILHKKSDTMLHLNKNINILIFCFITVK